MRVIDIKKSFKNTLILENVSFNVEKGKCIGLIGANGSGKSTLLSILAGLQKQDKGCIEINKDEIIGYVPQENPLFEELSVKDNLSLWKSFCKNIDEEYMKKLYTSFKIDEILKKRVKNLSGGMKKRVSIAIALIKNPSILILDEPSNALDLVFKEELKNTIKEFKAKGGSVILVTHDESELALCDEIFAIKNKNIEILDKNISIKEMIENYIKVK